MDLLGSIMGSMDKPPTASEQERKMQKAMQAKIERHLEVEQKHRAKFKSNAEAMIKCFVSDDVKKKLSFPKSTKVYRTILHEVAEAAGLFSHSVGEGDEKDVFITKEPAFPDATNKKIGPQPTSEHTSAVTTPPSSDYRQKYQHLIGGLDCAEKTAVVMEPNRVFGYVPSANKRDHRSIEETMNDLKTRKKPRLDSSIPLSSPSTHTPHTTANSKANPT